MCFPFSSEFVQFFFLRVFFHVFPFSSELFLCQCLSIFLRVFPMSMSFHFSSFFCFFPIFFPMFVGFLEISYVFPIFLRFFPMVHPFLYFFLTFVLWFFSFSHGFLPTSLGQVPCPGAGRLASEPRRPGAHLGHRCTGGARQAPEVPGAPYRGAKGSLAWRLNLW